MDFYNDQFCAYTGFDLEDLPRAMADDRDGWQKRESKESLLSACLEDDDVVKNPFSHTKLFNFSTSLK